MLVAEAVEVIVFLEEQELQVSEVVQEIQLHIHLQDN
jgi:hypothetical protein